jgi:outer membrane protein assembly factor BamE (lipoprotein component of BamABCDE complex)
VQEGDIVRIHAFLLLSALLAGCATAPEHRAAVRGEEAERLTVGKVQREIRVGMSGADVIKVLGSPNIVATDDQRREVWTYDKVSTETVYSESRGGVAALILGAGGSAAVGAVPQVEAGSGARATTQRTLTIVVRFDANGAVRDFAYHATQF